MITNHRSKSLSPYTKLVKDVQAFVTMDQSWNDDLLPEIPKKWERHGDLVILPSTAFKSQFWKLNNNNNALWNTVANALGCSRLAQKSTVTTDNFRSPQVNLLKGSDGWVKHTDNGIKYSFDVTKCMFSSGNITEKLRIANLNCTEETVVDLYAGDVLGMTLSCTHPAAFFGRILLLTAIYVRERGRGLGKILLNKTMAEADERDSSLFSEVHLIFNEGNDQAWKFYTHYGIENLTKIYGITIYEFGLPEHSADPSSVCVRSALENDRREVVTMLKDFRVCCSSPFWSDLDSKDNATSPLDSLLVAENKQDGKLELSGLVGYTFRYSGLTGHTAVVLALYVKESFRRQGVGSALMRALFQESEKQGSSYCNALLPPGPDTPCRRFFERYPKGTDRTQKFEWQWCRFSRPKIQ